MTLDYPLNFEVAARSNGAKRSVVARGELDSGAAQSFTDVFEQALAAGGCEQLVLDLGEVSFIDSMGIRAIIGAEQAARDRGAALVIVPPPAPVTALLEAGGVAERLSLADRPEAGALERDYLERIELELPRDPGAPSRARREVRQAVAGQLGDEALNAVTLLSSELVTNAVIHSGRAAAPIGLRITVAQDGVRVEVSDAGAGFAPERAVPSGERAGGRGLLLVDGLATRWGTTPRRGDHQRFAVWFELDHADSDCQAAACG